MWSKEKKIQEMGMASSTSVFAAGLSLKGDIESTSDIRIEGDVTGNVSTKKKLVVGSTGLIRGNVSAAEICIMGEVYGDLIVQGLAKLTSSAQVKGKIVSAKIEIEAGASVEGMLTKMFEEPKGQRATAGITMVKFDKDIEGKGFALEGIKNLKASSRD